MVKAANIKPGQTVLEIGPGLGILTTALLNHGANVVGVELDQRLFIYLKNKFRGHPNLTLIKNDIFQVNLHELVQDGRYAVVANLPYSATSLVFRNFLTTSPRPAAMTVMVQRDVARRMTAQPGAMSMLSLMVQYYSRPTTLFDVPPKSFWPVPKVFSTVLRCDRLQPVRPADRQLFRLMRAGFSARRKQLHNTLSATLHLPAEKVDAMLKKSDISMQARAQELSLEKWLILAKNFS